MQYFMLERMRDREVIALSGDEFPTLERSPSSMSHRMGGAFKNAST